MSCHVDCLYRGNGRASSRQRRQLWATSMWSGTRSGWWSSWTRRGPSTTTPVRSCRPTLSSFPIRCLGFHKFVCARSQKSNKIWIRNANRMQMQNVKVWNLSLMSVIDSWHYQGDHVSMVVILPPFLDDGLQVPTWYKFGNLVVNNLKRLLINLKIVHHLNDFRRLLI